METETDNLNPLNQPFTNQPQLDRRQRLAHAHELRINLERDTLKNTLK
jgi:hypothetical protein